MLRLWGSARGPWGWRRLDGIETPRPSGFVGSQLPSLGAWHTLSCKAQTVCCPSQVAPPFQLPGVWTSLRDLLCPSEPSRSGLAWKHEATHWSCSGYGRTLVSIISPHLLEGLPPPGSVLTRCLDHLLAHSAMLHFLQEAPSNQPLPRAHPAVPTSGCTPPPSLPRAS